MKKLLSLVAILGVAFALTSAVKAESYNPYWDISGNWNLDYNGGTHTREFRNLVQTNGAVTGEFWYLDGTWKLGGPLVGWVDENEVHLYYERESGYNGIFSGVISKDGMEGYLDDSSHNHIFWSTEGSPVDIKAPVVTLLSPDDNYITNATSVRQEWVSEDTDVDEYEYRSCTNNPNEEECDLIYKTTTTNTYRYVNNNNIIFWWQVRATDKTGNTGEWSDARKITIDPDLDGVVGSDDLCNGTDYESRTDGLGTNRWIYTSDGWETREPKGKGPKDSYTIEQTYGCSCDQILTVLEEKTGEEFEGHHKFGCSKSILEAWIAGEYYVGPTYMETVEVLGTGPTPVSSVSTLESDKDYILKSYGTFRFANWGNYGIADPEWAYRMAPYYPTDPEYTDIVPDLGSTTAGWVKGEGYYVSECGLDIQVNETCVDWGYYNTEHEYSIEMAGTDSVFNFHIYDNAYNDNSGSLFVDIYEDKWVDLW